MSKISAIGVVYEVQPEPINPDCCVRFPASSVTFVLETRVVDEASLAVSYADDPEGLAEIKRSMPAGGFSDRGVSIHVFGTEDGHEYLRFDIFDEDPHYHYIQPSNDHNHWVPFDSVAGGDMLEFVIRCLTQQLEPMLREAGGESVANALNPSDVRSAVKHLQPAASSARSEGAVRDS